MTETRRLLIVCTANVCRSPVAEAMVARRFAGVVDIDGRHWTVASAGTDSFPGMVEPDTVAAAAARGLDISRHASRHVSQADLDEADLVLTMTRAHVRSVAATDPSAWPRTFTLKELVRRSMGVLPSKVGGFADWLSSAGAGRRAADMLVPSDEDDVLDPYRRGRAANDAMVNDVELLVGDLIRWGPWVPAPETSRSGELP